MIICGITGGGVVAVLPLVPVDRKLDVERIGRRCTWAARNSSMAILTSSTAPRTTGLSRREICTARSAVSRPLLQEVRLSGQPFSSQCRGLVRVTLDLLQAALTVALGLLHELSETCRCPVHVSVSLVGLRCPLLHQTPDGAPLTRRQSEHL